jgi:hypothetical protein
MNDKIKLVIGGREGRVSKKSETVIRFLESLSPSVLYIVFIIYKRLPSYGIILVKKR